VASIPALFGPYRLVQTLGPGHRVFLAVGPEGECVVRRPPPDRRNDVEFLSRFRRAAHLARRLAHDGLVAVQDVGEVEGEPYLAEEFVEGHDLAEVLQRCVADKRRVPVAAALHIGCELSRALSFLHEFDGLGLVHRKLQPAKVRLDYQGGVKLLDFASGRAAGADRALEPAFLAEDLPYLAPEQLGDGPVDRRADIYALGVIVWETLAGCALLSTIEGSQAGLARATREQVIERILAHQPPPPSRFNPEVRADLDAVVMRALAKQPEQRFQIAGEIDLALVALTREPGREAAARLLNRLFDANRERDERAALLATAGGRVSPAARGQSPAGLGASGSSLADPREVRAGPAQSPAPANASSSAEGAPASPFLSRTTVVSRDAQWWRRFFLIFGVTLAAAIVFNIYMTRRLDAEAAAANTREQMASGTGLAPVGQGPAGQAARSALAVTAATDSSASEPPAARPFRGAELSAPMPPAARPHRAEAGSAVPAARLVAGSATEPPADRPRPHSSAEGRKALDEARAAFERDDFLRAIQLGRAALAAGEGGAHTILGAAYFKLGRFDDAVREYSEALRLDPANPALAKRVEIARRAALAPR
jgi:serine/threonine protein kinase